MSFTGFHYETTVPEQLFIFFGKKRCPKCGKRLWRKKNIEIITGAQANVNHTHDPLFFPSAKVRHYYYTYVCGNCSSEYFPKDLMY